MTEPTRPQGPAKGVLDTLTRIATISVNMVESRIKLIAVELEEEKLNLIQLILLAGLTLLFTAFGLMCLLIFIFWAVDPAYRIHTLAIVTVTLITLAIIFAVLSIRKARQSTLLGATREQLDIDKQQLEQNKQPENHLHE